MKTKTVRKRFNDLEQAREYAAHVNKTLKRDAAKISEIYKSDFTRNREIIEKSYDEWLDSTLVLAYYEVCFDTKSNKF